MVSKVECSDILSKERPFLQCMWGKNFNFVNGHKVDSATIFLPDPNPKIGLYLKWSGMKFDFFGNAIYWLDCFHRMVIKKSPRCARAESSTRKQWPGTKENEKQGTSSRYHITAFQGVLYSFARLGRRLTFSRVTWQWMTKSDTFGRGGNVTWRVAIPNSVLLIPPDGPHFPLGHDHIQKWAAAIIRSIHNSFNTTVALWPNLRDTRSTTQYQGVWPGFYSCHHHKVTRLAGPPQSDGKGERSSGSSLTSRQCCPSESCIRIPTTTYLSLNLMLLRLRLLWYRRLILRARRWISSGFAWYTICHPLSWPIFVRVLLLEHMPSRRSTALIWRTWVSSSVRLLTWNEQSVIGYRAWN